MNIRRTIAMREALCVILDHEKVSYTRGVGPGCCAVVIEPQDIKKFNTVIKQWYAAISSIIVEVGSP